MNIIYEDWFFILIIFLSIAIYFPISLILNKCKNSDSKKIIFIKISISLSCICALVGIASYFYVRIKNNSIEMAEDNIISHILPLSLFITFVPGLLMLMFGNIKSPKPDKYLLKQNNYIDFSNYLNKRVNLFNYEEKYTSDRLKINRREIKQKRYYMIDTKLEELTEENFNELYDKEIFPIIEDDFNQAKNSMRYELFIVFIISVDRMSPMFNRFINTLDQDKRYYKLPIGVSFGGNKMYIPNEIEGFGLMQFNHLKKEFKKIMEIEGK